MSLKDYWTQPPHTQDKVMAASQSAKPSYLRRPSPKGCKCKVADARRCFILQVGIHARGNYKLCACACHTETGGFV